MNKTKNPINIFTSIRSLGMMVILMAVLFSAGNVYSQQDNKDGKKQRKTPEERAQKRADKMKEKLSLTEDQHKQVYDILLYQGNQMKSIWESGKTDQDKTAMKEKMKAVRESTNTQINSVLTSTQQQLWETHKKEMKEKHKGKKHEGKHKKDKELK